MRDVTRTEELLESILHMAINFGEHESYTTKLPIKVKELAKEMNLTFYPIMDYIKAKIAVEIYEHEDVYKAGIVDEEGDLQDVVEEFQDSLQKTLEDYENK